PPHNQHSIPTRRSSDLHRSRSLQRQPSQSETGNSSTPATRTNERDYALPRLGNNPPWRTCGRITRNLSGTTNCDWNSGARRLASISLGSTLPRTLAQGDTCQFGIEGGCFRLPIDAQVYTVLNGMQASFK